jgi:hypothetical protein
MWGDEGAALAPRRNGRIAAVKAWCDTPGDAANCTAEYRGLSPEKLAVAATEENVLVQMNNLSAPQRRSAVVVP